MSFINDSSSHCCDFNNSQSEAIVNSSTPPFHLSFFESEQWTKRYEKTNFAFLIAELIVAIFAILGNALVIIVFFKQRKLRRKTNYYIISLAFADLFVGTFGIPVTLLLFSTGLPSTYHFLLCLLPIATLLTFCNISIFSLFLISIDRIFSINLPLNSTITSKNVVLEIGIVWISGILIGFLPIFWHKEPLSESCLLYDVLADGYQLFRFIFVILIPATTMLVIYFNIYKIILAQLKNEAILKRPPSSCFDKESISSTNHTYQRVLLKRELRATVNISLIVFVFILSWFPLHIANLLSIFCESCVISRDIILLVLAIAHSNSAINPLLYAYHMRDIRKEILKLLGVHIPKTINSKMTSK